MLTYHIVWNNDRESLTDDYNRISKIIGSRPNADAHFVGVYVTGNRIPTSTKDHELDRVRILERRLEKLIADSGEQFHY